MVIIGTLLTLAFGWSVLRLMNFRLSIYGTIALSFLLGVGFQTLVMFYMALMWVKLTLSNVSMTTLGLMFLIFMCSVLFNKFRKTSNSDLSELKILNFNKLNSLEKLLLAVFGMISFYVILAGLYWPVVGWDSVALYDFRAKVFSITGFMDDAIRRGYFFGYPLMTSMAHTWVYLLGSLYPKYLYSLMYISFGVLFIEFTNHFTNRTIALVSTLLAMVAYPIFSQAAYDYTNVPYTIYFFISTAAMFIWTRKKGVSWLILSALMMGLSTWIRSTDPFWLVNIVFLLIWVFINRKPQYLIVYLLFFLPIQQSWSLYLTKMSPNVSSQNLVGQGIGVLFGIPDIGRIAQVSLFVVQTLFAILTPYFILLTVIIATSKQKVVENFYLFLLVLGNFGLLFVGAYIFSYIWEGWSLIGESLERIGSVFIPIFIFASAVFFDINSLKSFKKK